jgi:hypothetical protein
MEPQDTKRSSLPFITRDSSSAPPPTGGAIGRNEKKSSGLAHVKGILASPDADSALEKLFHLRARHTTWQMEVLTGFVQFVSCMYVLPVVPIQLHEAGFDVTAAINTTVIMHPVVFMMTIKLFININSS